MLGWFCLVCKRFFDFPRKTLISDKGSTSIEAGCPFCGSVFIMELTEISIKKVE